MNIKPGTQIGNFRIVELIGRGGMAEVYKAQHIELGIFVSIKLIRVERFPPEIMPGVVERFRNEARKMAQLSHPNIVKVTDYGSINETRYLFMDYLPGGTLKRYLGKPMPYQQAARLLSPIADALAYAHSEGVIHRDVKPSNILLDKNNRLLLSDFGVAKVLDNEAARGLTATGATIGTPDYMAPEQAMGGRIDRRVDIYSLGVILYELVTGRKPFTADTPMDVAIKHARDPLPPPSNYVPGLPQDVERVLNKALAKKPEDRFQSMEEFLNELMRLGNLPNIMVDDKKDETGNKDGQADDRVILDDGRQNPAGNLVFKKILSPETIPGGIALITLGWTLVNSLGWFILSNLLPYPIEGMIRFALSGLITGYAILGNKKEKNGSILNIAIVWAAGYLLTYLVNSMGITGISNENAELLLFTACGFLSALNLKNNMSLDSGQVLLITLAWGLADYISYGFFHVGKQVLGSEVSTTLFWVIFGFIGGAGTLLAVRRPTTDLNPKQKIKMGSNTMSILLITLGWTIINSLGWTIFSSILPYPLEGLLRFALSGLVTGYALFRNFQQDKGLVLKFSLIWAGGYLLVYLLNQMGIGSQNVELVVFSACGLLSALAIKTRLGLNSNQIVFITLAWGMADFISYIVFQAVTLRSGSQSAATIFWIIFGLIGGAGMVFSIKDKLQLEQKRKVHS